LPFADISVTGRSFINGFVHRWTGLKVKTLRAERTISAPVSCTSFLAHVSVAMSSLFVFVLSPALALGVVNF
jgi:hypothetical protein